GNIARRTGRNMDDAHTGIPRQDLWQPGVVLAREDVHRIAQGGQLARHMAHVNVLSATVYAACAGQRRCVFADECDVSHFCILFMANKQLGTWPSTGHRAQDRRAPSGSVVPSCEDACWACPLTTALKQCATTPAKASSYQGLAPLTPTTMPSTSAVPASVV